MENDQELTWSTAMNEQFKTVFNLIDLLRQQGKIDSTEKFLSDLFPGLEPSSLETIPKTILQKVQKALQEIDEKTAEPPQKKRKLTSTSSSSDPDTKTSKSDDAVVKKTAFPASRIHLDAKEHRDPSLR